MKPIGVPKHIADRAFEVDERRILAVQTVTLVEVEESETAMAPVTSEGWIRFMDTENDKGPLYPAEGSELLPLCPWRNINRGHAILLFPVMFPGDTLEEQMEGAKTMAAAELERLLNNKRGLQLSSSENE